MLILHLLMMVQDQESKCLCGQQVHLQQIIFKSILQELLQGQCLQLRMFSKAQIEFLYQLLLNGIVSDLVHYENAPNPNSNPISSHNACVPPTNAFDISGKIALIRRGNCNFSNKVKNAQDAGALAAIVYDTVVNNPTRLSMSSTGLLGITIPAIFISKEKAESKF